MGPAPQFARRVQKVSQECKQRHGSKCSPRTWAYQPPFNTLAHKACRPLVRPLGGSRNAPRDATSDDYPFRRIQTVDIQYSDKFPWARTRALPCRRARQIIGAPGLQDAIAILKHKGGRFHYSIFLKSAMAAVAFCVMRGWAHTTRQQICWASKCSWRCLLHCLDAASLTCTIFHPDLNCICPVQGDAPSILQPRQSKRRSTDGSDSQTDLKS